MRTIPKQLSKESTIQFKLTTTPIVSVLTTAFNREQYISEAIESVLASTFTDFELIIADDGSTDDTVTIARQYEKTDRRVKVFVNTQNIGDYPNRNKAASYASGKYLKYLDSDDIIYPYGLQVMVDAMEAFPDAGFGLASRPENERKYPVCISPAAIYSEHFNGFGHFNRAPGSSIIKKAVFEKEGGFSGERMIGDLELWLRLARKYSMVKFPFDLYWNRRHPGQEVQSGQAQSIYRKRTKVILEQALRHPDCPLPEAERKRNLYQIRYPFINRIKNKLR